MITTNLHSLVSYILPFYHNLFSRFLQFLFCFLAFYYSFFFLFLFALLRFSLGTYLVSSAVLLFAFGAYSEEQIIKPLKLGCHIQYHRFLSFLRFVVYLDEIRTPLFLPFLEFFFFFFAFLFPIMPLRLGHTFVLGTKTPPIMFWYRPLLASTIKILSRSSGSSSMERLASTMSNYCC